MTKLTEARAKKAQNALVVMYLAQGFAATAYVPLIPQLISQIGVNFIAWGTILGFAGMGSLIPLTFTHRLVARYGTRRIIRIAGTLGVLAMVTIPFSHNWLFFFVAQVFQNISFSAYTIAINAASVMLQKKVKKTIVGWMHASWSIGAASSAALSGVLTAFLSMPIQIAIVGGAILVTYQIAGRNLLNPADDGHKSEVARSKPVSWLKTPKFVWLLTAGYFAGVWPEINMIDWSSVFAKRELLTSASMSAIPYTCFTIAMIIGRLSIGPVTKRIHISQMSQWGGLVGSVLMLGGVLIGPALAQTNPTLGLVVSSLLLGIAGLGVGPMVPSFFTAAGNVMGLTTAQALSRMSMVNALVVIGAKAVMGGLAQQSVQIAFLFPVVTLFIAGLIASQVVSRAKRNEKEMLAAYPMTGPVSVIDD
ncbi:MAG: hypothetical protein RL719_965 [Actinomycetota bacterium]